MAKAVNDLVAIRDGELIFQGKTLDIPSLRPEREIGRGANGIVILCENTFLKRPEALKIWVKLRNKDRRDKFKQGISEAQKAAAAAGGVAPQIYSAGDVGDGIFYASMEMIEGETLKEYISKEKGLFQRSVVAQAYVWAIEQLCESGHVHGDPHTKNVIVRAIDEKRVRLSLLDFGTSHFTAPNRFVERHWRVVDETLSRMYRDHFFFRRMKGKPTSFDSGSQYAWTKYYSEVAKMMRELSVGH
ncbi:MULTISPECIES: AarF/UbiB family protein [unclassified Mesorhizobium]|uniref:AarF/UbiB family protein n=1 Tax=unclassified Mesorhizobium TaxID=325217 RepID=UPI0015E308EC|nr:MULTISPECIES: AarF/UbiB family protein [unclassified Mesorhizobium]